MLCYIVQVKCYTSRYNTLCNSRYILPKVRYRRELNVILLHLLLHSKALRTVLFSSIDMLSLEVIKPSQSGKQYIGHWADPNNL